jgi:type I restriction enzyme M protein
VSKEARWSHLQANAKQPSIGKLIDEAMAAIEVATPGLKGVLPKDHNRRRSRGDARRSDRPRLRYAMGEPGDKAKHILGRVYEYFAEWNG